MQWVELDGGDLCRNMAGGFQLDASEWKARYRKFFARRSLKIQ
jgi:hypothetical protein